MKELARAGKLIYVPGNHDMAMSRDQLAPVKDYMVQTFPGIDFRCDTDLPLGEDGPLIAEHSNRYCLFNAPDVWTNLDSFLPLGYSVTRCVAYQASKTGSRTAPCPNSFEFSHGQRSERLHRRRVLRHLPGLRGGLTWKSIYTWTTLRVTTPGRLGG